MKYKLIKWYPGLDKVYQEGTTVVLRGSGEYREEGATFGYPVDKDEVENNPEYWEKIKDKKYKILSFSNDMEDIFTLNEEGTYYNNFEDETDCTWRTEKHILVSTYCKIHSVKRLSDEKVFTIRDEFLLEGDTFKRYTIMGFELYEGEILVDTKNTLLAFKDIKYILPVVFTSEDDVDIYEGDPVWCCHRDNNSNITGYIEKICTNPYPFDSSVPVFSTKENAKEYVLMNKPCLSLNDIENMWNNTSFSRSDQITALKELIKNRI